MLLARTIAGPVKRLADGAERVRHRIRSRVEIPDLTARRDEIGDLSGALRDMTSALYSRIEAIESFAADVAHELKNPLTSLRSAVETLPLAKSPDSQKRLLAVIQHDVKRLDRLISDISDASRLDAELQRGEMAPVDLAKLLNTVVSVQNETRADAAKVSVTFEGGGPLAFMVPGHDSRLGQVINNLIDNARSFAPPDSTVRVTCRQAARRGRDRRRRRRPGHPSGRLRQDFRALLHRPAAPGLRPELRPRPVDLQADHRGPRRPPVGREPHRRRDRRGRRAARCWARASRCACRRCDGARLRSIHASAVLVGARAVLIRGPSGSGKSRLALALLHAARQGLLPFARLVADDRAHVEAAHGRLLVRPAPALAGPDRGPRARHPPAAS